MGIARPARWPFNEGGTLFTKYHINNQEDIRALIENEVAEDQYIEYKLELPMKASELGGVSFEERDKHRFEVTVAAFASTSGGVILFGVVANKGIPTDIPGVEITNLDEVKRQLQQQLDARILPPVFGIRIEKISWNDLADNRGFLKVEVPKSFNGPHMINFHRGMTIVS